MDRMAAEVLKQDAQETSMVLAAWARQLETSVIPNLPDDCQWKWVALQLKRELGQFLQHAE